MSAGHLDARRMMELAGIACFGRRWRAELGESFEPPESMRFINRAMQPDRPQAVIRERHRLQLLALIDRRIGLLQTARQLIAGQPPLPRGPATCRAGSARKGSRRHAPTQPPYGAASVT